MIDKNLNLVQCCIEALIAIGAIWTARGDGEATRLGFIDHDGSYPKALPGMRSLQFLPKVRYDPPRFSRTDLADSVLPM